MGGKGCCGGGWKEGVVERGSGEKGGGEGVVEAFGDGSGGFHNGC